ncbi:MAG TPA: PEP-CTERM sorting domain-containing protein [Candidatus Acidoferrum sp.]|jgi:hypothetical protein
MKSSILGGVLALALSFAFAGAAKADNIHLCDVSTGCSASSVIPISGSATTAFLSGNPTGDSLFLAILQPVADLTGNWNDNGTTLWSVLGVGNGSVFPNLASAISQESGATGIAALSFNVSDLAIGTWTDNPQTVTLPGGQPAGTIFMAFTEDADGNLALVTPWSSSLVTTTTTSTPEPGSFMLLGAGLIGLLALKRVLA